MGEQDPFSISKELEQLCERLYDISFYLQEKNVILFISRYVPICKQICVYILSVLDGQKSRVKSIVYVHKVTLTGKNMLASCYISDFGKYSLRYFCLLATELPFLYLLCSLT